MEEFEYRVVSYDTEGLMGGKVDIDAFQEGFTALGSQGWELVNSMPTSSGGYTRAIISIFKRKMA